MLCRVSADLKRIALQSEQVELLSYPIWLPDPQESLTGIQI